MLIDNLNLLGKDQGTALLVAEQIVREALAGRAARGEDYRKNYDMYLNRHEKYFKQRPDESNDVFRYRRDNAVKNNLCGFTVDLSAKYLYGKASKVVRRFSNNADTQKRLTDMAGLCDVDSFFLELSKKAAVFSETVARFIPVDSVTGKEVNDISNENTYPHPIELDPRYTFVKRNRYNKIVAVVLFYEQYDYAKGRANGIMELVVDDSRWAWEGASIHSLGRLTLLTNPGSLPFFASSAAKVITNGEKNLYGLASEFVHFVNNDDMKSDLVDIIDLNIALDESLTDKKHFFAKHGWPQMVSDVDLSQVQNSPNKIWEISGDFQHNNKVTDHIGFITWDGKMEDHAKFVKNIERTIMILSNTAQISTGDLESIGQLRSGAALITAHSVAIHKTEAKQIIWSRNEKAFFNAMINFDSYLHNEVPKVRYPEVEMEIIFPRDFVPGAEMERAQIQQIQFNSHIRPLKDLIRENYGNISDAEVDSKYAEILSDSENIVDSTRKFESTQQASGASGSNSSSMQKSSEQK